ncbi:probable ATP-dependent RNA helicase DHX35 [Melanaphis sacchari]|uniref:probable ATP-dependent RNA helicase DHX35 n=1 Tax=Melanaphis sacchari TaxID=742174 RepID=UPI000DC15240|nr:probable ATP-dependent RNA helicase DHX35 [Melanaphis sacchari]
MSSFRFKNCDEKPGYGEEDSNFESAISSSFVYNPYMSLDLQSQRNKLPITKYRNEVLYLCEKFQTLILVGSTGSGKSTQVSQMLLDSGLCQNDKSIVITEPRKISAITLATRVAQEQKTNLGQLVGYSVRFDNCCQPSTKIKYITEGILLNEMMSNPLLVNYSVIILDEIHERSLMTDILMGLIKKVLKKRPTLRLIILSATLDSTQLKSYFNLNQSNDPSNDTATVLGIEGRSYPTKIYYLKDPTPNYVEESINTVLKIQQSGALGDILVFLTGKEEIMQAVNTLDDYNIKNPNEKIKLLPVPMHGTLTNDEQLKAFRPAPRGYRKVVFSTNVAETSVTISGIVHVIDCGFVKLKWFNSKFGADSLIAVPISKASAVQRAGRAGRERPGKVYRLYTKEAYQNLINATPPEMMRSDLTDVTLQLKAIYINNVLRFPFLSPPPAKNLLYAMEMLKALEAIDELGNLTNSFGTIMAELPLPAKHSRILLKSAEWGCSSEIVSILAMLQLQDAFVRPKYGATIQKAKIQHRNFEVAEGDLLTLLNVYNGFEKNLYSQQWCHRFFINYNELCKARKIRSHLIDLMRSSKIPLKSCKGNTRIIVKSIASGLFKNAAYLHYTGVYRSVGLDEDLYFHPKSVMNYVNQPQWVLYDELLETTKTYIKNLVEITPSLLLEVAPHYFATPTL